MNDQKFNKQNIKINHFLTHKVKRTIQINKSYYIYFNHNINFEFSLKFSSNAI